MSLFLSFWHKCIFLILFLPSLVISMIWKRLNQQLVLKVAILHRSFPFSNFNNYFYKKALSGRQYSKGSQLKVFCRGKTLTENLWHKDYPWASLVAQWLRICLPMQGTRVRALVWEDPTCCRATGPVSHNYWACASGACAPQQERPR